MDERDEARALMMEEEEGVVRVMEDDGWVRAMEMEEGEARVM